MGEPPSVVRWKLRAYNQVIGAIERLVVNMQNDAIFQRGAGYIICAHTIKSVRDLRTYLTALQTMYEEANP